MADTWLFQIYRNLSDYFPSKQFLNWKVLRNQKSEHHPKNLLEDLPDELMESIVHRLAVLDRYSMSSVFERLKDIAPRHQLPWIVLTEDMKFFDLNNGEVVDLNLTEWLDRGWFLGSSKGLFLYVRKSFAYILRYLIYLGKQATVKKYPCFSFLLSIIREPTIETEKIFLLHPITKSLHQLPSLSTITNYRHTRHPDYPHCSRFCCFHNMKVSCTDISQLIVVVQIQRENIVDNRPTLALCRPGDKKWITIVGDEGEENFDDIIFHKGKLVAFYSCTHQRRHVEERTVVFGGGGEKNQLVLGIKFIYGRGLLTSLALFREVLSIFGEVIGTTGQGPYPCLSLVESCDGELLMVVKFVVRVLIRDPLYWQNDTLDVFVFKINPDSGGFKRMRDIGDNQVIFTGMGDSHAISTSKMGLGGDVSLGNCVYFTEASTDGRESGFYSFKERKFRRSIPIPIFHSSRRPSWFMPNINM